MGFWEDVAADGSGAWFDTGGLAVEATYTPAGGEAVECAVVMLQGAQPGVERSPVNTGRGVRYLHDEATAVIEAASAPSPANGDLLEVSGRTWRVRDVLEGNGIHWRLRLESGAKASHGAG